MVNHIINYEVTGAAGVEDGVVSVFGTRMVKIGGRECSCMERGSENGLVFAVCALMDYSIIEVEVADVFGNARSLIYTNEGKGIVAGITRIVAHPLASWMISIPLILSLSRGVSQSGWVSGTMEESGWGAANRFFILFLHVRLNDVGEDGDVMEV